MRYMERNNLGFSSKEDISNLNEMKLESLQRVEKDKVILCSIAVIL